MTTPQWVSPSFLWLESSYSLEVALAKVQAAYKDEEKTSLVYILKGEIHEPVVAHCATLMKSIAKLLLATSRSHNSSRKWTFIDIRFDLEFPFGELEEHRKRVDVIEKGYEELKSRIMDPLGLASSMDRRRWRDGQSQPQQKDRCSDRGEFRMAPQRENLLNFTPCLAPEDAIARLEEVWTNEKLTEIRVGVDLIYSKEFMDCLADIMADYYPENRFKSLTFYWHHYWNDAEKNKRNVKAGKLVDEWIGRVANRVGVEAKTLEDGPASSMGPPNFNFNEEYTACEGGVTCGAGTLHYCFDRTN